MKLTNHITLSVILHILLFSIFLTYHPELKGRMDRTVFDVGIVTPEAETDIPSAEIDKPPSPVPRKQPVRKKAFPDTEPPKSMLGTGESDDPSSGREGPEPEEPVSRNIPFETEGPEYSSGDDPGEPGVPSPEKSDGSEGKGLPEPPSGAGGFLFDSEIIQKYAYRQTPEEKGLTFDAPEFHHRGYMRMLKDKIERIWKYPRDAALQRISGDLYIRFSIRRDGSVGNIALIRTSGYQDLDEAALQAVRDGEPYWPLPDDWKDEELSITGHFIYVIGKYYML